MKKLLTLLLLCPLSNAVEYEAGVKTIYIEQKLFGTIDFRQPTTTVVGNVWLDNGFGLGVTIGKSSEVNNSKHIEGLEYSNAIKLFASYSVMFKHSIYDGIELYADVGVTDYRTSWKVNGKPPAWAHGMDSDYHWGFGVRYEIANDVILSVSYVDYYRKSNETTVGYSIGLTKFF
jgi:hypothetical protein